MSSRSSIARNYLPPLTFSATNTPTWKTNKVSVRMLTAEQQTVQPAEVLLAAQVQIQQAAARRSAAAVVDETAGPAARLRTAGQPPAPLHTSVVLHAVVVRLAPQTSTPSPVCPAVEVASHAPALRSSAHCPSHRAPQGGARFDVQETACTLTQGRRRDVTGRVLSPTTQVARASALAARWHPARVLARR